MPSRFRSCRGAARCAPARHDFKKYRALVFSSLLLLLRIERMLALLVELVLDSQAVVVGFHRLDAIDNRLDPILHVPFAKLFRRRRAVTRIMLWKTRVPPDTGVKLFRQCNALLVGSRFAGGTIDVRQFRMRVEQV